MYRKECPHWKYGIKTFYSKIIKKPDLMIISYQPGGGEEYYIKEDKKNFLKRDFRPPTKNSKNAYEKGNNDMAKFMQDFFNSCGKQKLFAESVIFPLIFFRAPSVDIWRKKMKKIKRLKLEQFCFSMVKEIVKELQPQNILILGFGTYNQMKKQKNGILQDVTPEGKTINGKRKRRIATIRECAGSRIFTSIHPTGSRPKLNVKEKELIKKAFADWINKGSR